MKENTQQLTTSTDFNSKSVIENIELNNAEIIKLKRFLESASDITPKEIDSIETMICTFEAKIQIEKAKTKEAMDVIYGSIEANNLINQAGCRNLALYINKSIQPESAVEEILAAQLAGLHNLSMKFIAQTNNVMHECSTEEVQRLNNMAIKSSKACSEIATTISKLKSGFQQEIIVKHQNIEINDGGQAVIANGDIITGVNNEK